MEKYFTSLIVFSIIVLSGTFVYHNLEGWSWVDSFFYAGTAITTGGSSMHLTRDSSKVFTVVYIILGFSTAIYAVTSIGKFNQPRVEKVAKKVVEKLGGNNGKRRDI